MFEFFKTYLVVGSNYTIFLNSVKDILFKITAKLRPRMSGYWQKREMLYICYTLIGVNLPLSGKSLTLSFKIAGLIKPEKMNKYLWGYGVLVLLLLQGERLNAQFQQVDLYPQLSGQALIDRLVTDYKPATVLEFGESRDTLFGKIYAVNDSLHCVYTRHAVYLPPGQDPTQAVFMNGSSNGINTEHTWPQAFGAGAGNARADMHHLHPSKVNVNSARANLPFAESADANTDVWYYQQRATNTIPNQSIDQYSELGPSNFEPREDHKGNVARAMFYFYTMYRAEVDAEDPNYFGLMRETLCRWHHEDPVDELEWKRTMMIAKHQDGKANPFVLDCSLPQRSYCNDQSFVCEITPVKEPLATSRFTLFDNRPNPFTTETLITYQLEQAGQVRLTIYNLLGQVQEVLIDGLQISGEHTIPWQSPGKGIYLYQLEVENEGKWQQQTKRMIAVE